MNKLKGAAYGLISSSTFGLIPLFTLPVLKSGVGVHSILFYRYLIAALLIGGLLAARKISLKISLGELLQLMGLGLFAALSALLLFEGYQYLSSGVATTIHFLYPVFVAILMITFFREKKSLAVFLAIGLAITGVAFLSLGEGRASFSLKGVAVVATSAVTYALYIVGVNKTPVGQINAQKLTFYIMGLSALFFLIFALVSRDLQPLPDLKAGLNITLLALLPTVVSNLALVYAVTYVGSTMTAILGAMESVTAVCIGLFVFHEPFSLSLLVGILCVLSAVNIIILSSRNRKNGDAPQAP